MSTGRGVRGILIEKIILNNFKRKRKKKQVKNAIKLFAKGELRGWGRGRETIKQLSIKQLQSQQRIQILGYHISVERVIRDKRI